MKLELSNNQEMAVLFMLFVFVLVIIISICLTLSSALSSYWIKN